jgi:hypothetical protein
MKEGVMCLLSMDDFVCMHVFQGRDHLDGVALYFELVKSFSSSKELVHRLTGTQLQQNIDTIIVLEEMLKANNMLMHKRSVNFDLTQKLYENFLKTRISTFCRALDLVRVDLAISLPAKMTLSLTLVNS